MNHVALIGRLTRDPELRYTPNGVAVCQFSIAVDREFKNQQGEREADFVPIVTWQKLAEICGNNLKKGRLVAVEGRLQIRSYTPEGQTEKRRVAEVIASSVQFLDKRDDGGQGSGSRPSAPPTSSGGYGGGDDFGEINLDDLPF